MPDCRACKSSHSALAVAAEGFWENEILSRLRLYPFRCRRCGSRFYAFQRHEPVIVAVRQSFPAALPAADEQGFRKAVDQIRMSEGRLRDGKPQNGSQPARTDGLFAPRLASDSRPPSQPAGLPAREPGRKSADPEQRRYELQRELANAVLKLIQYQCIRIEVNSRPAPDEGLRQPKAASATPSSADVGNQSVPKDKKDSSAKEAPKRIFTLK